MQFLLRLIRALEHPRPEPRPSNRGRANLPQHVSAQNSEQIGNPLPSSTCSPEFLSSTARDRPPNCGPPLQEAAVRETPLIGPEPAECARLCHSAAEN